jgi:hypothetical protein
LLGLSEVSKAVSYPGQSGAPGALVGPFFVATRDVAAVANHHQASAEQQTLDLQGCVTSVAPWLDFPGPRAPKWMAMTQHENGWLLPTNWMASPFQTYVTYVYI